jgi:hypothetical protein
VLASLGGLGLVRLFMLAYYRLAGVNALCSVLLNLLVLLAIMAYLPVPLTLPGIAGLILTIGMGVDSNVLIFERIKEELASAAGSRAPPINAVPSTARLAPPSSTRTSRPWISPRRSSCSSRHHSAIRGLGFSRDHAGDRPRSAYCTFTAVFVLADALRARRCGRHGRAHALQTLAHLWNAHHRTFARRRGSTFSPLAPGTPVLPVPRHRRCASRLLTVATPGSSPSGHSITPAGTAWPSSEFRLRTWSTEDDRARRRLAVLPGDGKSCSATDPHSRRAGFLIRLPWPMRRAGAPTRLERIGARQVKGALQFAADRGWPSFSLVRCASLSAPAVGAGSCSGAGIVAAVAAYPSPPSRSIIRRSGFRVRLRRLECDRRHAPRRHPGHAGLPCRSPATT